MSTATHHKQKSGGGGGEGLEAVVGGGRGGGVPQQNTKKKKGGGGGVTLCSDHSRNPLRQQPGATANSCSSHTASLNARQAPGWLEPTV